MDNEYQDIITYGIEDEKNKIQKLYKNYTKTIQMLLKKQMKIVIWLIYRIIQQEIYKIFVIVTFKHKSETFYDILQQ